MLPLTHVTADIVRFNLICALLSVVGANMLSDVSINVLIVIDNRVYIP